MKANFSLIQMTFIFKSLPVSFTASAQRTTYNWTHTTTTTKPFRIKIPECWITEVGK